MHYKTVQGCDLAAWLGEGGDHPDAAEAIGTPAYCLYGNDGNWSVGEKVYE